MNMSRLPGQSLPARTASTAEHDARLVKAAQEAATAAPGRGSSAAWGSLVDDEMKRLGVSEGLSGRAGKVARKRLMKSKVGRRLNVLDEASKAVHRALVPPDAALRVLIRKWGIKGDLSTASEIELALMLFAHLRALPEDELPLRKVREEAAVVMRNNVDHFPSIEATIEEIVALKDWEFVIDKLKLTLPPHVETFCEGWRRSSFARLAIGHKLAAALMLTSPPAEPIASPWECWSLHVPDGLLELNPNDEDTGRIGRVWCHGSDARFLVVKRQGQWALVEADNASTNPRVNAAVKGFVKGVLLTMDSDPRSHITGQWGPAARPMSPRAPATAPAPTANQYELGGTVQVDLRAQLKQYLSERGSGISPSVQFLVRGHWRNQVCGAGRADRRYIWIEPYWKGPEESRVLLRTHFLKNDEAGDAAADAPVGAPT